MAAAPRMKLADKQEIYKKVLSSLKKRYPSVAKLPELPVLETMLFAVCLENATVAEAEASYKKLFTSFHDLNEVRVSSIEELETVFHGMSTPDWRAMRIRGILTHVFESAYTFELEGLRRKTLELATKQLAKIRELTPFIRDYTLHESLGAHVIPLDDALLSVIEFLDLHAETGGLEATAESLKPLVRKAEGPEFSGLLRELATDPKLKPVIVQIRQAVLDGAVLPAPLQRFEKLLKGETIKFDPPPKKPAEKKEAASKESEKKELDKKAKPAAKSETGKSDAARHEPAKTESTKSEPTKGEATKADATKVEHAKSGSSKKFDAPKADATKTETAKPEQPKTKAVSSKTESNKAESGKAESSKTEVAKQAASKTTAVAEGAKATTAKPTTTKADKKSEPAPVAEKPAKATAAKPAVKPAKADAAKGDGAKVESTKSTSKADATKPESTKADSTRSDTAKGKTTGTSSKKEPAAAKKDEAPKAASAAKSTAKSSAEKSAPKATSKATAAAAKPAKKPTSKSGK